MKKPANQSKSKLQKAAVKKFLGIIEKCGVEVAIDHAEGCVERLNDSGDAANMPNLDVHLEILSLLYIHWQNDQVAAEHLMSWAKARG